MSVLNTLPAPIVQMGLVEKIVEMAQNQPLVQQQAAQEAARQMLKEQGQRIAGVETTKRGKKVSEREADENDRPGAEQDAAPPTPDNNADEAPADSGPSKANPWAGHIVNVKI